MQERKTYTREFKQRAASMVLDDNCSVPDVCASMDVGQIGRASCRERV